MQYRAEIDGLRTAAVLPVVAFHAGLALIPGGFVGVDVFFVISGYLISSIILSDLKAGRFSVLEFYKRRFLRILPALMAMMLAVLLLAYHFMLPNEFVATGKSVVSTAAFFSNVYFWSTSGYFEASSNLKPLLHTWSLAVEEQFYILFPILLIVVRRWLRQQYRLWIAASVALSFGLSVYWLRVNPSTTFYMLPTRFWELGLGSLIACGAVPTVTSIKVRNWLSLLGAGLLAYGIFFLSETVSFPGANALYPCLGAALIIHCSSGTAVARVLSLPLPVFVGKISYSLYLWHWPIIVFYKLVFGYDPAGKDAVLVLGLSLLMAYVSYRWVEQPFRSLRLRNTRATHAVSVSLATLAAFLLTGGLISARGSTWQSYPGEVGRIAAYTNYRLTDDYAYQFRRGTCFVSGAEETERYDREDCLKLLPGKHNYVLLGDSHGGHFWRALSLAYPDINVIQVTMSGCRPLLNAPGRARCRELFDDVLRNFIPGHRIDGVILAGRWQTDELGQLSETLAYLGKTVPNVVVFGPTVEYKGEFPILLAHQVMSGETGLTSRFLDASRKQVNSAVASVVSSSGAHYVDIYDLICQVGDCLVTTPSGVPMQFDYGHLTLAGAKLVVAKAHDQLQVLQIQ